MGLATAIHSMLQNVMPWYTWPEPFGIIPLALHRAILERQNLFPAPGMEAPGLATYMANLKEQQAQTNPFDDTTTEEEEPVLQARPDNGYGTDVEHPPAGARGSPFARNCPALSMATRLKDDLDPPVQEVAQKLLARRTASEFYPAGMQLNVLAAAWIQAMVHDWVGHFDDSTEDGKVQLEEGHAFGCPLGSFEFRKTLLGKDGAYDSFRTHWWDASWLYGQSHAAVQHSRSFQSGKVRLSLDDENAKVGTRNYETGTVYNTTGDNMNSWLGVSLLQELFLKEHNAVAQAIVQNHPEWADDDERVFGMARLVVSALLAKIHTIDWTVELLKTRTLQVGMRTNWYGLGKALKADHGANLTTTNADRRWSFFFPNGILDSFEKKTGNETKADNKGVPFSLTEEFTAVYRLHPLLPDQLIVHLDDNNNTNNTLTVPMSELFGEKGERALRAHPKRPLQYWDSILRYPCGSLQLHNFPHSLRNVTPTDELGRSLPAHKNIDLAAIDLYRDRERGILRFNDFRRSLKLPAYKDWMDLTGGDETYADELADVYGEEGIERCELQVGRFAEKKLPGFALSETSFVVFLLMATRRLEADPFLHEYYTEENYSATGLEWIESTNNLRDVLARHYPALLQDIPEGQSVFTPRTPWPGQEVAAATTAVTPETRKLRRRRRPS